MGARESVPRLLAVRFGISIVGAIGFEPWAGEYFFASPEALRERSFHRFRYLRFFISRNLQALLRQGKDDSVLVVRKGRKDAREEYQHAGWCERLKGAWIAHGMSRMGNFIGNGATEQVFGHVKDEFF